MNTYNTCELEDCRGCHYQQLEDEALVREHKRAVVALLVLITIVVGFMIVVALAAVK